MSTKLPTQIDIQVKTAYLTEHSEPAAGRFAFAYTITLRNSGKVPAQLISRHWKIIDGNDQLQEVKGIGVVGEQPRLLPEAEYTYSSGAILETATGTMEGSYHFCTDDGFEFEAPIPLFALLAPGAVH